MASSTPLRVCDAVGFTLTEMLVSISILTLLVLLVTQLINSATAVMTRGHKGADADTEARLVFDRMAADFAKMIRRGDVDFFGKDSAGARPMEGNDQLAFYSAVPGYYSMSPPTPTPSRNARNAASVVAYSMSTTPDGRPQLVRLAKGLVWETDGGWQGMTYLPIQIVAASPNGRWPNLFQPATSVPLPYNGMADADYEPVGDSVVRFEYCYLLQPTTSGPAAPSTVPYNTGLTGHTPRDFHRDVAAVNVAIAVLDPTSRAIVSDYSQLMSPSLFPDVPVSDATTPNETATGIAKSWTTVINQPTFAATARIPQIAASAVRVYQRRFILGSNPGEQ